jgi:hypothetical protein
MPYSRRTGRRYAAGSSTSWGTWESRECVVCGQKITLKQSAFHGGATTTPWSIHAACGGPAVAVWKLDAQHAQEAHPGARQGVQNPQEAEETLEALGAGSEPDTVGTDLAGKGSSP